MPSSTAASPSAVNSKEALCFKVSKQLYFLVQVAALNKRKTIKFADVQQALNKDPRWEHSGIRFVLQSQPQPVVSTLGVDSAKPPCRTFGSRCTVSQ